MPAGAFPKDGPSAGISMATSIASLLTNIKVDSDLAMTGEVTLTGQVLPIGGVKEKVLGAKRAGIKKILLPKRNEMDLDDVPKEVRDTMQFVFVEELSEVFMHALGKRIITPVLLGVPARVRAATTSSPLRPSVHKRGRTEGAQTARPGRRVVAQTLLARPHPGIARALRRRVVSHPLRDGDYTVTLSTLAGLSHRDGEHQACWD